MDWSKVPLSEGSIKTLGIQSPEQLITVGPLEDRFMTKMDVDIISQRKGVFRTILKVRVKLHGWIWMHESPNSNYDYARFDMIEVEWSFIEV